jgi:hypothetical protein
MDNCKGKKISDHGTPPNEWHISTLNAVAILRMKKKNMIAEVFH